MRGQALSDKNCLNILRGKDPWRRGRPSKDGGDQRVGIPRRETRAWRGKERAVDAAKAGTRREDKTVGDPRYGTGAGRGAGTRAGKKAGIRAGMEWGDERGEDSE